MVKYILTVILIIFSTLSYAQSTELTELLNSIHSMQANFSQTIYDNHGKAVQQAQGKMAIERPGKFRWQVIKPIPQLVIANGSRLWIYDPDLEQVTIRTVKQTAGEAPALLLSHVSDALEKEYQIQTLPSKNNLTWFKLTPKKSDSMFATIELGFKQNQIDQMRLQDHLGHTTAIQFQNIQTNLALSAATFNFNPPKNVDVIDETRK